MLIILNLIWIIPAIRAVYSSASILALETVRRVRSEVNFSLGTVRRDIEHAAEEIGFDPERERIILDFVLKHDPAVRSIGVVDLDGRETFRVDRFSFVAPADLASHASTTYFTSALRGQSAFGDVFISPELEPHMVFAVPVLRAGMVEEVLMADINIRGMVSAIQAPEIAPAHIYVTDGKGYEILDPNLSRLFLRPDLTSRSIVRKVIATHRVADGLAPDDGYVNESGQAVFAVGMPMSMADFSIFLETPRSVALSGERQVLLFGMLTTLIGAVLLFVVIEDRRRLRYLNLRLGEILQENNETGKMLVSRDRELTAANRRLQDLLREVDTAGKMLVRRDLELSRANERLEEMDRVKSEFVTIAAHQLRTPLTGIRWSYQTMLEEDEGMLTAVQRRILQGGLSASLRMINLVNDLLSVARIEEGKFGFHFARQSPRAMIERAIKRFEKIAREKGIQFAVQIPDPAFPVFSFDEEKLSIVLDNLLDNSVKYTEPGGVITLEVIREGEMLRITVRDTGIGISAEELHRVFSKFFRAGNALRFHTSGTGLGLYVAHNIVARHNGTMSVQSGEGKGTTFTVILPMGELT